MVYVILAIAFYCFGCISTGYIVGKMQSNIDVRKHGSGSAGATNVFRVLGTKAGIITFISDFAKGAVASLVGLWLGGVTGGIVCSIAVVLGHNWPLFLKFKGGKGIATTTGTIIVLNPVVGIILLGFGIVVIALTRYVSLGSIMATAAYPVVVFALKFPAEYKIHAVIICVLAILRHTSNIKRLKKGNERKLGVKTE
ncbi:MAG TPA: glycerol-3-phosphate 1-O-acyltransferase PlsY [Clostridiales bacterium]|nr:glycerol-3-phosphate 1-O-acyltransferase PlsY [Clostridiales bacterium]